MKQMKDRKTKQIKKQRPIYKKPQDRNQSYGTFGMRKKLYQDTRQLDRSQQCPFLTRIFYSINQENYYKGRSISQLPTDRQIKLHLWMNSTLKQISQLIRAVMPSVRTKQRFTFWRLVYSKQKKDYQKQQLGWVYALKRTERIQEKPLYHTKFKIGDMIDVSINYK